MKNTLLVINCLNPQKRAFDYALQFCHIMMTDLLILQVVDPKIYNNLFTRLKHKARLAHKHLENTMAAAALSESNNQDIVCQFLQHGKENINQSIPNSFRNNVHFSLQQRIGHAREEILNFLNARRDIAMAVYDGPQESNLRRRSFPDESFLQQEIPFRIGIPFIKPTNGIS